MLQGIWLGRNRADNRREIEAALQLARRHPGTVKALIVGNEVLLRGELAPATIKAYLEEVKRRSGLPVTYADVWEFWLSRPSSPRPSTSSPSISCPIGRTIRSQRRDAVAHVREVRDRFQATFPGKEIWIGEVGWPSEGRMRAGALPSPANQARVLSGVVAAAKQEGLEGQPHRGVRPALEAAVGRDGRRLLGALRRSAAGSRNSSSDEPVSNHPDWRLKAGLGIGAALLVFVAFWLGIPRRPRASALLAA